MERNRPPPAEDIPAELLDDIGSEAWLHLWSSQYPEYVEALKAAAKRLLPDSEITRTVLFLCDITSELDRNGIHTWAPSVQDRFREHKRVSGTSNQYIHEMARRLQGSREPSIAKNGFLLSTCCSRDGYEDASLDLGIATQKLERHGPGRLRDATIAEMTKVVMRDLGRHAAAGSVLAATLRAELASQKDPRKTEDLWKHAINLAIEHKDLDDAESISARFQHLRKPWLQAASALWSVNQIEAKRCLKIGMEMDDADAYALYAQNSYPLGLRDDGYFLEWINAATKSAASGSVQSAMALGDHYADSAPQELDKITFPEKARPTAWERAKQALELTVLLPVSFSRFKQRLAEIREASKFRESYNELMKSEREASGYNTYQRAVAEYDASSKTPQDRVQMAIQWWRLSESYMNIEASLRLAHIHSRKYIFQLFNSQFEIRHPDYQTDRDILKFAAKYEDAFGPNPELQEPYDGSKELPVKDGEGRRILRRGIENPDYSPRKAASYLKNIALCRIARDNTLAAGAKTADEKRDIEPAWYTFPDVAKSNEDKIEEIWKTAKYYCDVLGIDIFEPKMMTQVERGLIYRHRGTRGKGICEVDVAGVRKNAAKGNKVLEQREAAK
ncbi:hypothetical protein CAC42_7154 [Sphaceloma murrayae]|uniref:Uncharacterized protein n=1 Tax=Sphaceloma murrayae TaxID=2082308 RepID=A0A2K1QR06_9PEZI|nr:hypothetical protein CAC42_7154 [Sphaceloma murrayae]